jgi:hypothetical protein
MLLYRPIGLRELRLIADASWRAWPPRLPHQPIFYPVLSFSYARTIARDWNPPDEASGFVGFVSRFQLKDEFAAKYEPQRAGGEAHVELWVPASDLPELNQHIRGFIEIVEAFPGEAFKGSLDPLTHVPSSISPPRTSRAPLKISCPCCRALTLDMRGGFECCPVCYWEDDGQDDADADDVRGGPNGTLSLSQARANFAVHGASEPQYATHVRPSLPDER